MTYAIWGSRASGKGKSLRYLRLREERCTLMLSAVELFRTLRTDEKPIAHEVFEEGRDRPERSGASMIWGTLWRIISHLRKEYIVGMFIERRCGSHSIVNIWISVPIYLRSMPPCHRLCTKWLLQHRIWGQHIYVLWLQREKSQLDKVRPEVRRRGILWSYPSYYLRFESHSSWEELDSRNTQVLNGVHFTKTYNSHIMNGQTFQHLRLRQTRPF